MSSYLPSAMKALFNWYLLSVLLSSFGLEKNEALETQFQLFNTSHYHLSSVCNRASKAGFKDRLSSRTVLEVLHRHNPCAENDEKRPKLSFAKILENDELRVKSIQDRVMIDSINTNGDPNYKPSLDKRVKLPAPQPDGNYLVTIGLGKPKRKVSLIFDTGSYITWTQCQPCPKQNCYRQKDQIFDPHNSTTYSNILCNSKYCPHHDNPTTFGCYHGNTCIYGVLYGDDSYTKGFLSKEKLTVTPTDVFPDFVFGCGHNNSGIFSQSEDGILGLGRHPISIVSQTAHKYGKYFSYCLPSPGNSLGFLAFGKNTKKHDEISTPFVQPPPGYLPIFYFIEIVAITVGGTKLAINELIFKKGGTVIDSGTMITRLPPAAYDAMSEEFSKQMKKMKYKSAPTFSILDTCFYIGRVKNNTFQIPTVSFTFKFTAKVDLDASGVVVQVNRRTVCLAFAKNNDTSDMAVFGNTQQSTFEVTYDVAGNKLGFIRNPDCK